jgi:hypothetical protein
MDNKELLNPKGEMSNIARSMRALRAVQAYWGNDGTEELETKIKDLCSDLRHLCASEDFDFDGIARASQWNFEAEVEEEKETDAFIKKSDAWRKAHERI